MVMTDPAWQQVEDTRLFESAASAPWNRGAGCPRCGDDCHAVCHGNDEGPDGDESYWQMIDEAMDTRQQAEVQALEAQGYDTADAWAMAENDR